jgi:2-(1,2-epoxy-1,2-dihydrophenyl)acetyl-CoA isomerase
MDCSPTSPSEGRALPPLLTSLSAAGVLEICLDRPSVHNAMNGELSLALLDALDDIRARDDIGAILLRGAGPSFCSGQDLKETPSDEHAARVQDICRKLRDGPPAVAMVQGHAIGAGAEIAFACDLIVVSPRASFRLPEVEVGLAPGGGVSLFLVTALGPARAAQLLLLGEGVGAAEAVDLGLAYAMSEEAGLLADARRLAEKLAERDVSAMRLAKRILNFAWLDLYEKAYAAELEAMLSTVRARAEASG